MNHQQIYRGKQGRSTGLLKNYSVKSINIALRLEIKANIAHDY